MAITKEDEAGTIYENTSNAGKPYLKLTIRGQKFIAFRNAFKKEDRHPDWNVYVDKPRDGGDRPEPARPQSRERVDASDIPF